MASNHVPSDQVPLQGQNIYTDPSYSNFFSNNVERYGTPSWDAQLHQNAALTPNSANSNWHGTYPQQAFNAQQYGGQPQTFQTTSPYQYGQFNQHSSAGTYGAVDPALAINPNGLRQQQQSPYQVPVRNVTPTNQASTVTPQALQQNISALQHARASASPFQVNTATNHMRIETHVFADPKKYSRAICPAGCIHCSTSSQPSVRDPKRQEVGWSVRN